MYSHDPLPGGSDELPIGTTVRDRNRRKTIAYAKITYQLFTSRNQTNKLYFKSTHKFN